MRIDSVYVYGDATPEIREPLDGFGTTYLTALAGVSR